MPEQPESRACRERFQKRTGEAIDPTASVYTIFAANCGLVELFSRSAAAAGPGLSRARWLAAVGTLGAFPSPTFGGTISYQQGKADGGDCVRTKQLRSNCGCFVPVDDFVRFR